MKKETPGPVQETLFIWTGGDIQRVHKTVDHHGASPRVHAPAPTSSEMRSYPRLDLKLPILYKVIGKDDSKLPSQVRPYLMAQSTNISPLGLCLNLPEHLEPGSILALSIHVVDQREKFNAVGRVLWTQVSPMPDHFLTGLQFVVVEDDVVKKEPHRRMADLIRRLEAQE